MNNNRGSAMIWAMAALMVIVIIIALILTLSLNYSERTTHESMQNQAYLSARSAVDVVLSQISNYSISATSDIANMTEEQLTAKLSAEAPLLSGMIGVPMPLTDFQFSDSANMGEITSATITRTDEDTWVVSVTAQFADRLETVEAVLERTTESSEITEGETSDTIPVQKIFHGFFINTMTLPSNATLTVNNCNFYLKEFANNNNNTRSIYVNNGDFYTYYKMNLAPSGMDYTATINGFSNTKLYLGAGHQCVGEINEGRTKDIFVPTNDMQKGSLDGGETFISFATSMGSVVKDDDNRYYYRFHQGNMSVKLGELPSAATEVHLFFAQGVKPSFSGTPPNINTRVYIHGDSRAQFTFAADMVINGDIIADQVFFQGDFTLNYIPTTSNALIKFKGESNYGTMKELFQDDYHWGFVTYQ